MYFSYPLYVGSHCLQNTNNGRIEIIYDSIYVVFITDKSLLSVITRSD